MGFLYLCRRYCLSTLSVVPISEPLRLATRIVRFAAFPRYLKTTVLTYITSFVNPFLPSMLLTGEKIPSPSLVLERLGDQANQLSKLTNVFHRGCCCLLLDCCYSTNSSCIAYSVCPNYCRQPMLLVVEEMEMRTVTQMAAMTCHRHCWKSTMTLLLMIRMSLTSSAHLKKHSKVIHVS